MKSAPAIAFDVQPSRRIGAAAAAIALLATAAPWLTGFPLWGRALCSLAAFAFAALALRGFLRPRFRRVAWRESGWTLVDRDGAEHVAALESHAHLGALLALGFRLGPRRRFRLVLAPDNLDADSRRRLVLLLARVEAVRALPQAWP